MDGEDSFGEEIRVMSEVHLGCPPGVHGPHLSRFIVSLPPEVESRRFHKLLVGESSPLDDHGIVLDEDGDLVLPRRGRSTRSFCVAIQHNITSSIPEVGLQVWKAELILSDFVLHKMFTSSELDGVASVELGAGTGLVGLLLACVGNSVFITDHGDEILENCARNVGLNAAMFNSQAVVNVRELDWRSQWPIQDSLIDCGDPKRYSWSSLDLEEVKRATFVCAADVIYDDDLTDALFSMLERLLSMGSEKVLYLALEKRYNFSLDDLEIVANGYSGFRRHIKEDGDRMECESNSNKTEHCFVGRRIDITQIPQYVKGYDREDNVELWEIRYIRARNSADPTASIMS